MADKEAMLTKEQKADMAKAVEYYKKGAEADNSKCKLNLGICLFNGNGIERDCELALKYLEQAAYKGEIKALEKRAAELEAECKEEIVQVKAK